MNIKRILPTIGIIFMIMSIFVIQTKADPNNGSISGFVINDINRNGQWDINETTVQGWPIYLIGNIAQEFGYGTSTITIEMQTNTDINGSYKFNNLSAGDYQIIENNTGFNLTSSDNISINLAIGQSSVDNNFFGQLNRIKGDLNNNQNLDVVDVLFAAQALAGIRSLDPEQESIADVDNNPGLDIGDVLFVAQAVAGLRIL